MKAEKKPKYNGLEEKSNVLEYTKVWLQNLNNHFRSTVIGKVHFQKSDINLS